MKLSKETISELVLELVGEDVVDLVNLLADKSNISEFKLAEKLNLSVNQVRSLIYRLSSFSLVSSVRKRDKKKGWYVYYWTLNRGEISRLIISFKKKKVERLKILLGKEEVDIYYVCTNKCVRYSVDGAMEHEFKCQECGGLLVQDDSLKKTEEIKKEISKIEEELKGYEERKVKVLARKVKKVIKKIPKKKIVKRKVKKIVKKTKKVKKRIKRISKKKSKITTKKKRLKIKSKRKKISRG